MHTFDGERSADMNRVEHVLRRLALNDERSVHFMLAQADVPAQLDAKTQALVRLGALLSVGAATVSLRCNVEAASAVFGRRHRIEPALPCQFAPQLASHAIGLLGFVVLARMAEFLGDVLFEPGHPGGTALLARDTPVHQKQRREQSCKKRRQAARGFSS